MYHILLINETANILTEYANELYTRRKNLSKEIIKVSTLSSNFEEE